MKELKEFFEFIVFFLAIIGVIAIELVALSKGIDGKVLTFSVATIASLVSVYVTKRRMQKKYGTDKIRRKDY